MGLSRPRSPRPGSHLSRSCGQRVRSRISRSRCTRLASCTSAIITPWYSDTESNFIRRVPAWQVAGRCRPRETICADRRLFVVQFLQLLQRVAFRQPYADNESFWMDARRCVHDHDAPSHTLKYTQRPTKRPLGSGVERKAMTRPKPNGPTDDHHARALGRGAMRKHPGPVPRNILRQVKTRWRTRRSSRANASP